jgi:hypothetical protein
MRSGWSWWVSTSLRSKSSSRGKGRDGTSASSSMFVVVAAAYQRADTHNPPFSTSARHSFASNDRDYIAFYIPGHHYRPASRHGSLPAQTRATRILQPDMGRYRRRATRPKRPTRREDTPRMGAQARNEEVRRRQGKEDLAQVQPQVACLRRSRRAERRGARCAVASSQETAAHEPQGHGEDDPEAQWQKARIQGDALGQEKECSAK